MKFHRKERLAECPGCRHRMAPMGRKPIVSTDCLVDVTYICEWCGTETKRAEREQRKSSHSRHTEHGGRYGLVT
jgi:DNA-directed RNA polymerase subunit RPC12/RpoP